jgi:hypothetical protein
MKIVPDSVASLSLDQEIIDEWLDTFDPSVKTFASHLVINLLPRYGYHTLMDAGRGELPSILVEHFECFLKLKFMDAFPGRTVSCIHIPSD